MKRLFGKCPATRLITLRALAPTLAVLTLWSCAGPERRAPSSQPVPPPAPAAPRTRAQLDVSGQGGPSEAGRRLALALAGVLPPSGRIALGWPEPRGAWVAPLASALARARGSAVLLRDLGVHADSAPEALRQLPSESFAGLLWMTPEGNEGRNLEVAFHPTRGRETEAVQVHFEPPLSAPRRLGTWAPRPLARFPGTIRALGWDANGDSLWAVTTDSVLRLEPGTGAVLQSWPLPGGPHTGAAAVAPTLGDELGGRVGAFDLASGWGQWFTRRPDGNYDESGALDGFPMGTRLSRFLTAPFDADSGRFRVEDPFGQTLGSGTDLIRFQGPAGSLFCILDAHPTLVRGDSLQAIGAPVDGAVEAGAAWDRALVLAMEGDPARLEAFRLNGDWSWETLWEAPLTSPAVTAMAAGAVREKPTLFVAVPGEAEGSVLLAGEWPGH